MKSTGPIPPELGELTELVELTLNNNELTGPIPAELGKPHQPDGLKPPQTMKSPVLFLPSWVSSLS